MTVIATIDAGEVAAAAVAQIKDWPKIVELSARVEDSEPVNEDASRCPWVGVYLSRAGFPQRTLGLGAGYRRQEMQLSVAMTECSADSGLDCKNRLGVLVKAVTSALCSDESLRGTVNTLAEMEVIYADYRFAEGRFFQAAVVNVTAVTNVAVEV